MSKGRTNSGNGGGGSLNYKIVGGTTQPSNPKENWIWVNTDVPITIHAFSATEPANPVEGMVWFNIGTSCTAPINLLKKGDEVWTYPTAVQQYINGALVSKTAKTYQGGEWVDWWNGELYVNGDQFTSQTGGWIVTPKAWRTGQVNTITPTVTYNTDNMYVEKYGGNGGCVFSTKNQIDLTDFSTITADVNPGPDHSPYNEPDGFIVWQDDIKNAVVLSAFSGTARQTRTLDISELTGKYNVGFRLGNGNETWVKLTVWEVKMS